MLLLSQFFLYICSETGTRLDCTPTSTELNISWLCYHGDCSHGHFKKGTWGMLQSKCFGEGDHLGWHCRMAGMSASKAHVLEGCSRAYRAPRHEVCLQSHQPGSPAMTWGPPSNSMQEYPLHLNSRLSLRNGAVTGRETKPLSCKN